MLKYVFRMKSSQLKCASIFYKTSSYDEKQKQYKAAYEKSMKVQTMYQKLLEKKHLNMLMSMNNLTLMLINQDKCNEVEEMHQQELELCKKMMRKEHIHTLISMSNLTVMLNNQSKYAKVEEMNQQMLKFKKKMLKKKHLNTLMNISNLMLMLNN